MITQRVFFTLGSIAFLAAILIGTTTHAVCSDLDKQDRIPDSFRSPNGHYAVAMRYTGVNDKSDGPTYSASAFLVGMKSYRVICQIKQSFQTSHYPPENDFECYWKSDSSMLGVVYSQRDGSEQEVLAQRGKQWHRLTLPQIDFNAYKEDIARHSRLKLPTEGSWSTTSMSFNRHGILVVGWGQFGSDGKYVDAHLHYRYLHRHGRWIAHVGSINVETD